jgi:hypothetical protein
MTKKMVKRYLWAAELAKIAMGRREKRWGGEWAAVEDPLAWWCLTEGIAEGGPKIRRTP